MRDILINSQKVELPFICEKNYKDDVGSSTIKYLVTYDYFVENEVNEKSKKIILVELEDGFIYTMTLEEFASHINEGGWNIKKANL